MTRDQQELERQKQVQCRAREDEPLTKWELTENDKRLLRKHDIVLRALRLRQK